jgi:catechol 2,3-dioxygenase-like lactoylglutathione lyase family enzyme
MADSPAVSSPAVPDMRLELVPLPVSDVDLKDMAATWAALTERGIELSDVEDMGGVLYSYFRDPDGNMWALQQWPAGYQA